MTRLIATFDEGIHRGTAKYPVADGSIRLTAPAHSAIVLTADC
jgi:hypothetical protein